MNRTDGKHTKEVFYTCQFILLFILLFFFIVSPVFAANVTLQWAPNKEPNLAGYRVFLREKGRSYDYKKPSLEVTAASCNIDNLNANKTYFFVVRAFNREGFESGDSNEVCLKTVSSPDNEPPIAVIAEEYIEAVSGKTVVLDGSGSSDNDGIASYLWEQIAGPPVSLYDHTSPVATFVTPETGQYGSDLTFRLTATDIDGLQNTANCSVFVLPKNESASVILETHFDNNESSFSYLDDSFRDSSQPRYADGVWSSSGGFTGGALKITLGGMDKADIIGMSGGWEKRFVLSSPTEVVLSFHYKLIQAPDYEDDEFSQVLVSVDQILYGDAHNDYVVQTRGDGNGGSPANTGWHFYEVNLGILEAGNHILIIGGYNNKKTYNNEYTEVLIDDVLLKSLGGKNRASNVDAGSDRTIPLSAYAAFLDGTVVDNKLTAPTAAVITMWHQLSGPAVVDFLDAKSVDTGARFSDAGTYVLELVAYDGEFISSDTVTITVVPSKPAARLESGTCLVGGDYVTVNLANTYARPVVVCTVHYSNNTAPVVTRVNNVTPTRFNVRLQSPSSEAVKTDMVSYLVVEAGTWAVDDVKIEAQTYTSTVTDGENSWVGEAQYFGQSYTSPVVIGQVMSENDPDWSVFWCQGSSRTDPPSAAVLRTGKTVGEDMDIIRADETIGFIVFESGHGVIRGVEFEASVGIDSVRGVSDSPPFTYNFNTAFGSVPKITLGNIAGMKGYNGAWAYMYGATPASATKLYLSVDEDRMGDSERFHTAEQIGYVVFEEPFVYH